MSLSSAANPDASNSKALKGAPPASPNAASHECAPAGAAASSHATATGAVGGRSVNRWQRLAMVAGNR